MNKIKGDRLYLGIPTIVIPRFPSKRVTLPGTIVYVAIDTVNLLTASHESNSDLPSGAENTILVELTLVINKHYNQVPLNTHL